MRHIKFTDYTISDWMKQAGVLMVLAILARMTITSVARENYVHTIGHTLGLAGWIMIYFRLMKKLRERNPQD